MYPFPLDLDCLILEDPDKHKSLFELEQLSYRLCTGWLYAGEYCTYTTIVIEIIIGHHGNLNVYKHIITNKMATALCLNIGYQNGPKISSFRVNGLVSINYFGTSCCVRQSLSWTC